MTVHIFTDGACIGNPGPGGCAAIIRRPGMRDEQFSRGYRRTTNNRMELLAVIHALEALKGYAPCSITLTTDSMVVVYGINAANSKAKKKQRANEDLWQRYHALAARHKVQPVWVKGHAGHAENEIADRLAARAAENPTHDDTGYGSLGELFG